MRLYLGTKGIKQQPASTLSRSNGKVEFIVYKIKYNKSTFGAHTKATDVSATIHRPSSL